MASIGGTVRISVPTKKITAKPAASKAGIQKMAKEAQVKKAEQAAITNAPKTWTPWTAQNVYNPQTVMQNAASLAGTSLKQYQQQQPLQAMGGFNPWGMMGGYQPQMMGSFQPQAQWQNPWQSMSQNMFSGATPWGQSQQG